MNKPDKNTQSDFSGDISFRLEIGKYSIILRNGEKDSLWLEDDTGEGMQVWNKEFFDLLDTYFRENF